MNKLSIFEAFNNGNSYYSVIIAVSKRARQIVDQFNDDGIVAPDNPVMEAVKEFEDGKYVLVEPYNLEDFKQY